MINSNKDGLIECPCCKLLYKPVLKRVGNESIQTIYPNSAPWEREQLISGLCSEKCWDVMSGIDIDDEYNE